MQILKNYRDIIIQINHFYVQDKRRLEVLLSGLTHCLSLLPCDESHTKSQKKGLLQNETLLVYEQDAPKECVRFAHVSGILKEIVGALINCFQDFIPLFHAPRGWDEAQSLFGCVRHILCSIRYAIKFYIRRHTQRQTASEEVTLMKLDQDIASMLSKKLLGSFPLNPKNNISNDENYFILNGVLTEIFLVVSEWSHLPCDLSYRFLEFIENTLLGMITRSISKPIHEETLLALLPFVPKLTLRVDRDWTDNLMQAFTITLRDCKPESPLKLACISVVRDLIIPNGDILYPNDPTVVLQLLLDLGRVGWLKNASPTFEEDIRNFFNPYQGEGDVPGGPFASLPREAQELALSFLYCFTIDNFSSPMLRTIVSCCLYQQLEPAVLYRIEEIIHTAYRDGYIQITDHFSFLITLIACFRVVRGESAAIEWDERQETTFKTLTKLVCSCLSGMGDSSLVLQILERVFVEQIILKPALDNGCGILRMIYTLDSKPTRLSESSVTTLSEFLPGFLIDIVNCIPEDKENPCYLQTCLYYLVPCFFLFDRSSKLTEEVLKRMRLMVSDNVKAMLESSVQQDMESSRNSLSLIQCIVSVILLMHNDVKVRKIISSFKSEIDLILHNVITLQSSSLLTVEGKHMMKIAVERLRIASNSLVSCTTVTIE